MYEDIKLIRELWMSLKERLYRAGADGSLPETLRVSLAQSFVFLERAMSVVDQANLKAGEPSWLGRFFGGTPKPSVGFQKADGQIAVKKAIQNGLANQLGVNSRSGDLDGLFGASAESLAFLELLHTVISFEERLGAVIHDPHFTDDDSVHIGGLHQAFYALEEGPQKSIPQGAISLSPDQKVLVLAGPNNAGKSHLLRALGQGVLMAQAGMGVTAQEARLPLATGLLTHQPRLREDFRRGENPKEKGPPGKLEAEIGALASIRDRVKPGTWVLLDEMLAGVANRDVVTGVARGVIDAITERGGRTILVTHDLGLVDSLSQDPSTAVYIADTSNSRQFKPADHEAVGAMTVGYDARVEEIAQRNGFGPQKV